jgi:hypothetical protein
MNALVEVVPWSMATMAGMSLTVSIDLANPPPFWTNWRKWT